MKSKTLVISLFLMTTVGIFGQKKDKTTVKLSSTIDSVNYIIGVNIAQNLIGQGLDSLKPEIIAKAFSDVLDKKNFLINQETGKQILQKFSQQIQEKQKKEMETKGLENKKKGDEFLSKNKNNPNVKVTHSGLQYIVEREGTGEIPKETDKVRVHYKGTFIDGKVFDSSYDRGEPIVFPLNGVIPGWTEALQLMKVGSKYKIFVPSELGYGEEGAGGIIGPNETLIFEIELLEVVKQ